MKAYQEIARVLEQLLGRETAVRIHAIGFMPLVLEEIGRSADGGRLLALFHTAVQNGDLMRGPEIVFELYAHGAAEPLSFRNDFGGVFQEVHDYDARGRKTHGRRQETDSQSRSSLSASYAASRPATSRAA